LYVMLCELWWWGRRKRSKLEGHAMLGKVSRGLAWMREWMRVVKR
jgi:hypothetical protein